MKKLIFVALAFLIVGCSAHRVDPLDIPVDTAKYRKSAERIYYMNKLDLLINEQLYPIKK